MKYERFFYGYIEKRVALFTRAWIEITGYSDFILILAVALFTRAWIEIETIHENRIRSDSRPLHEGVD